MTLSDLYTPETMNTCVDANHVMADAVALHFQKWFQRRTGKVSTDVVNCTRISIRRIVYYYCEPNLAVACTDRFCAILDRERVVVGLFEYANPGFPGNAELFISNLLPYVSK